jgi:hypothetical protein
MSDLRAALERRRREVLPEVGAMERLVRRRERRRQKERITSAVVAVLLVALTTWALSHAAGHRTSPAPAHPPIGPSTVGLLHLAWSGQVEGPVDATRSRPVAGDHEIYVSTDALNAFPASCGGQRCGPSWVGVAPSAGLLSTPAVGGGMVFVSGGRVYGFPEHCTTGGRTCAPTWMSGPAPMSGRYTAPTVRGGVVYASVVGGDLYAFPVTCGESTCEPLWHGHVQASNVPPAAGNGVENTGVFAQGTEGILMFPMSCRADGGLCRPVWRAPVGRASFPPAVLVGSIFFSHGPQALAALRSTCAVAGNQCPRKGWPWARFGHRESISGTGGATSVIYVTTSRRLYAIGGVLGQGTLWRGPSVPAGQGPLSPPTVGLGLVLYSTDRGVFAFPQTYVTPPGRRSCPHGGGVCLPMWRSEPGRFLTPPGLSKDGVSVVTRGGQLEVYGPRSRPS